MARPDTWMPIYWGDYLKDTMHLTTEQHGAYMLLIAAHWTRGCPLSDDNLKLAGTVKCSLKVWQRLRPVLAEFFEVKDGEWRHKRVCEELEKAKRVSKARQEAGKVGGKRKAKAKQTTKQNPTPSQSPKENPLKGGGSLGDSHKDEKEEARPPEERWPLVKLSIQRKVVRNSRNFRDWIEPQTPTSFDPLTLEGPSLPEDVKEGIKFWWGDEVVFVPTSDPLDVPGFLDRTHAD